MIHRVLSAVIFGVLALSALPLLASTPRRPEVVPLLSGNVVPVSYDLTIAPVMSSVGFGKRGLTNGEETIVVQVKLPTSSIALNASGITIRDATIDHIKATTSGFPIAEQVAFRSVKQITPGLHELRIRFQSAINGDYPGLWSDSSDANAPDLVSDFEPASARTLFPCFDEPQYRARFTLHAVAPNDWTVISNMPLVSKNPQPNGLARSDFQQTPLMPTYLLTIDMGKFTHVSSNVGPTPVTVYARPGKEDLARHVLENAIASMKFFEDDLGTPFPLPKLDIVVSSGVLNDTEQGYGAITAYTEYEVDGNQFGGGLRGKQDAFSNIAGTVSGQWLGDLVSPSWWSDAWVTYGFIGSEEQRAERALHPEFAAIP